ncbi:hypothetical protein [Pseudomonas sp. NBRC 111124]|uniref:hypothetical protein n=1 Tax=Pseudomonas sp. NBRC 111124 TaxID=1661039 RepID=UPI0007621187|nr:hypothetical protein [Pseudomonas sp. NBRC 111124]
MKKQTVEEFVAEMKKGPQTFGWDVVLAFARDKTNQILMQEYIERFHAEQSYFPLINDEVDTIAGRVYHYIEDLQVATPVLSFINASIEDSMARLQLRSVAGKMIEAEQPVGTTRREIMRVAMVDGLLGPTLEMDISLKMVTGGVGEAGEVVLDMSAKNVVKYQFNGVDSATQAVMLAEHLGNYIDKNFDESEKVYPLSQLRLNDKDALQPGEFIIRTQASDESSVRDSDGYEDGLVLIFIALKGNQAGAGPNKDMMYLLPKGGEYSTNLVLSNDLILRKLFIEALGEREQLRGVDFKPDNKPGELALTYYAANGSMQYAWESEGYEQSNFWRGFKVEKFECKFSKTEAGREQRLRAGIIDEGFSVKWDGATEECEGTGRYTGINGAGHSSVYYEGYYISRWTFDQRFQWSLKAVEGRKHIALTPASGKYTFDTEHQRVRGKDNAVAKDEYQKGLVSVRSDMRDKFEWLQDDIKDLGFELDAFRLNGLLFSDESVVEPEVLRVPGDMCVLGKLSAARTEYTLTPALPIVAAGVPYTFKIEPASSGFDWRVDNVPDDEGYVGTIKDGVYTPPSAESFGHTFKRAIVTASKGAWTGKALVNVVATPLSVFPLVASVSTGAEFAMWAASVDGKALTATVEGNAEGDVVASTDPLVQQIWKYKTDIKVPEGGWNPPPEDLVDYVVRVDKVVVKSASHGTSNEIAMIVPLHPVGQYFIKVKEVGAGEETAALQMELWTKKITGVEVPVKPEDVMWRLLVGKGKLDENTGVYTPEAGVHEHYVAVAGLHVDRYDDGNGDEYVELEAYGYKIIPVPFVSLEKLNDILGNAVQEVHHG